MRASPNGVPLSAGDSSRPLSGLLAAATPLESLLVEMYVLHGSRRHCCVAVRRHFRGPRRLFWPRLGGSLLAHLLLPFQTLGQTDALPVELVDVAAVGEPVQQGCRQGSIAKDPGPFGKGQVGGH